MLDFTSALYLGLEHASWDLSEWPRLTSGKPAALEEIAGTLRAQWELAALTGCERVMLSASTLHLFTDLFGMLGRLNVAIWIDGSTYPIARWGADRALAAGIPVRVFPAHDVYALRSALNAVTARPVIVTDGYCPIRGSMAPLPEYARCAQARGGLVVVDDTQALGVLGRPSMSPYGNGGGGSLRYFNLRNPKLVIVSSLAKAFGAPIAMLGGSRAFVDWFKRNSATAVHCSPPSSAAVSAALHALAINRRWGDMLRRRLANRVVQFRRAMKTFLATGSLFPVQPLRLPRGVDPRALYRDLLDRGISPVLHRESGGDCALEDCVRISFIVTSRHRRRDIERAAKGVANALAQVADVKRDSVLSRKEEIAERRSVNR